MATLRQQDRSATGTFDTDLQIQTDWTGDRERAVLALPELIHPKAAGGTDLYEALERALRRQFGKIPGRRAVIVLTDGRDTSIYTDLVRKNWLQEPAADRLFQKTLKVARDQRVPVYFVAFNTDKNLDPNTVGSDEYRNLQVIFPRTAVPDRYLTQVRIRMEQIAEASGGRILFPESLEEIVPLYQEIGRE